MLSVYPACFFIEDTSYSVIFPDLNDLATCGSDMKEAMTAAVDCLAGYLYCAEQEGEELSPPSDMASIDLKKIAEELDISAEGAFINIVSVDVSAYAKEHFERAVKKTLTIPSWLNKAALEQNVNFSFVLKEALIAKVKTCYEPKNRLTKMHIQPKR